MIVDTLNMTDIIDRLMQDKYASWTYEQAEALADYYEQQCGGENYHWEFNKVEVRSEWSAYKTKQHLFDRYRFLFHEDEVANMETIENETLVIKCRDNTYLVREF